LARELQLGFSMPQILTRDFGEVAYEPSAECFFPRGLPGFEDQSCFVLMQEENTEPLVFLQSLQTPSLCFLAVSVWMADPAYQVGMTRADLDILGLENQPTPEDGTLCLGVLSGSGDMFTVNLLAPVVVNLQSRTAVQAVRADAAYSHCHPLRVEAAPCL
jgi:flagellar assembly factor FliW